MKLENEIVTDVDATVDVIVIARRGYQWARRWQPSGPGLIADLESSGVGLKRLISPITTASAFLPRRLLRRACSPRC